MTRIYLAPMEGVVDHHLRKLLTAIGGIDTCVTEFIRVTDHLLPEKVFYRLCPELTHNSQTESGIPVRIQLLGGSPQPLADNAAKAANLGAAAIDLNFGCPAKTVNKSDGGAVLLQEPERVYKIVHAVRQSIAQSVPVTAKIRLGFHDRSLGKEVALAVFAAGADELTVHARSKVDGYKPPAYWECIAPIQETAPVPVIANGEIWSVDDYIRCREISGCTDIMLGRGLLACPDLALQIKARLSDDKLAPMQWQQVCQTLFQFYQTTLHAYPKKFLGNRVKQWLVYLRRQYPEAIEFFEQIKTHRCDKSITALFDTHIRHTGVHSN